MLLADFNIYKRNVLVKVGRKAEIQLRAGSKSISSEEVGLSLDLLSSPDSLDSCSFALP